MDLEEFVIKDFVEVCVSVFRMIQESKEFRDSIDHLDQNKFRTFVLIMGTLKDPDRSDSFLRFVIFRINEFLKVADDVSNNPKFSQMRLEKFLGLFKRADTYLTQELVLQLWIQVLQKIGKESAEFALIATEFSSENQRKNSYLKKLFTEIQLDEFDETSRPFLNQFNMSGGDFKIVSIKGIIKSAEIKTEEIYIDFNVDRLSLSFSPTFKNLVSENERLYMEIESSEIDKKKCVLPGEGSVYLIQPKKYQILRNFEEVRYDWGKSRISFEIRDTPGKLAVFEERIFPLFKRQGAQRNQEPFDLISSQLSNKHSPGLPINLSQDISQPYFEILGFVSQSQPHSTAASRDPSPAPSESVSSRKSARLSGKKPGQKTNQTPPRSLTQSQRQPSSRVLKSHSEQFAITKSFVGGQNSRRSSILSTTSEFDVQFKEPKRRNLGNPGIAEDVPLKKVRVVVRQLSNSDIALETGNTFDQHLVITQNSGQVTSSQTLVCEIGSQKKTKLRRETYTIAENVAIENHAKHNEINNGKTGKSLVQIN